MHDINHNRPEDGGLLLLLDNTKAFDRLQHPFMLETLAAFGMPASVLGAVGTLYNGAQTCVKVNGELGIAFDNSSGVKQGCPLSPLLYVLVQEVQLRMIRDAPDIHGIPIPDADGGSLGPRSKPTKTGYVHAERRGRAGMGPEAAWEALGRHAVPRNGVWGRPKFGS